MADDAGALLVRSGLVSASALDNARAHVETAGGTIGEQLVATGIVSDAALTDFYRQRLLVPMVNPNTLARLPAKVVATIPSDMAVELRAVPVSLDADNNLTVAMSDPSDRHAVDEIAFFTGAYVVRAVATQMQIAWCLAHYYGHVTPLGTRLVQGGSAGGETAPSPPKPRTRGHTGKVDAARHRVLAPVTGQITVQRPTGRGLDDPRPGPIPIDTPPLPVPKDRITAPEDAAPEIPRARTASGEIRLPRAQSVRPPVDDASGPTITIEVGDDGEEPTGPNLSIPKRRTPARTDPPELAARAGEVSIETAPIRLVDLELPNILISDDAETPTTVIARPDDLSQPVVIHSTIDRDSQPILLERKRPSDPPATEPRMPSFADPEEDDDETDIVVLDAPKGRRPRPEKRTQIGMGAVTAATLSPRAHRDTEADGLPAVIDDGPTMQMDAAVFPEPEPHSEPEPPPEPRETPPALAASVLTRDTAPGPAVAPVPRTESFPVATVGATRAASSPGLATSGSAPRITAVGVAPAPVIVAPRRLEHDDVDDGWGPPGTTIPPPLLGAMPGADELDHAGTLPIQNVDAAPLVLAPPAAPERISDGADSGGHGLVRELEDATARAIDLIRRLDNARDRDEVIGTMVEHLASSHRRAGFFAIRPLSPSAGTSLTGVARGATELALFTMRPTPASIPAATLPLDRPSTMEDIVGTRLPYRGPMHDDASRTFLQQILGTCPPEILLVPVAVRERVVGVLFGEHRVRHTFDDQLALAARAAGMALERILAKTKR